MWKIIVVLFVIVVTLPPFLNYLKRRATKKKELKEKEQIIPIEDGGQAYLIRIKRVLFKE
jgi:hypothetical protein